MSTSPSDITAVDPVGSHSAATGSEGGSAVAVPSIRNGDTKFFSRTQARLTIWPDGTLVKGGQGKGTAVVEENWVCDGTLWLTKVRRAIDRVAAAQANALTK